jgi:hypothetical protein
LVITLVGCAAVGKPDKYHLEADILNGTWEESDGTFYAFLGFDNSVEVLMIIDNDDEIFEVKKSNWKDGVLSWTFYVPSTEYTVRMATTSISENEIHCTWENHEDNGTEVLTRYISETELEGSSKKAKSGRN